MIAVIDYKMGNLRSVQKALEVVGADTRITSDPADLRKAEKIVFPGVGAFGDAMRELKKLKLDTAIKDAIAEVNLSWACAWACSFSLRKAGRPRASRVLGF
jgi:imidazole glycerol-phosphate synthase subunit HisH